MKLSLVELATVAPGGDKPQALQDAVNAARQAEDLGYHRIWYAEHHDAASAASSAPEILIALAAHTTSRIRVGSGAVLLNHYSPYKVAETFLQLEALAPGRIDLGLGGPRPARCPTSLCAATATPRPPTTSNSKSKKYSRTSTAASLPTTPSRA